MKIKLAAFTMIELIVVMVLSGVIFSMALLVIEIVGQQARHQEEQHQEVLELEQLELLLQKDAYQSKAMWVEQEQLLLEYEQYTINYQFGTKNISRTILQEPLHTDTFYLPSLSLTTTWQGQPLEVGRIDQVEWSTQFFEQPYTILIQKKYDSKTLLEINKQQQ